MLWGCIFKLKNITLFVSFRLNSLVSELAAAAESSTLMTSKSMRFQWGWATDMGLNAFYLKEKFTTSVKPVMKPAHQ
jgi:hypothetical protein